ncbi:P-loop containing nucleoside triphosphate hydrolase protein [Cladorrhinum sp. PSN332]|nr:P-loop containing nucleoside triphosphate hydrolase protein [Cladorrhinum sp. PSN332]
MDGTTENANSYRSGLRAPRVHATNTSLATTLQEITNSENNARAQATAIPSKRTYQFTAGGMPQPEAKRKTLAEKAGEPLRSQLPGAASAVSSRLAGVKPASIANLATAHPTSNIPGASRNVPSTNFGKSIGPGSRPPISSRAPTSMGFNQPANGAARGPVRQRPATSMGNRGAEEESARPSQPQKKGRTISSFPQRQTVLRSRKIRTVASDQSLGMHVRQTSRDLSGLSTRLNNLSLDDDDEDHEHSAGDQVVSEESGHTPPPSPLFFQSDASREPITESIKIQSSRKDETAESNPFRPVKTRADTSTATPSTPPQVRSGIVAMEKMDSVFRSITKIPFSPVKQFSPKKSSYLTKDSNLTTFTGWDVDGRLNEFETQFKVMKEAFDSTITDRKAWEESMELAKNKANELERDRQRLMEQNHEFQSQIASLHQDKQNMQQEQQKLTLQMEAEQRRHKYDIEDKLREHKHQVDEMKREFKSELDQLKRDQREALEAMERRYRTELEDQQTKKSKEIQELQQKLGSEQEDLNLAILRKERETQEMRSLVETLRSDLERELTIKGTLKNQLTEMSTAGLKMEDQMRGLKAKIEFLESDSKQQSDSFATMEARLQEALRVANEAKEKLIKEETERRVLFNKYQELKGNIRVMCRVRPVLSASEGDSAMIGFPDEKTSAQIDVTGPEERTSLGAISRRVLPFEFDRVFSPAVHNEEVFGEISQLVQSALDGYNVCIFCYGQTGSGKTYTMSSPDGMIPRAVHMIYETITKLKEKSWTYTMEGSFIEVYNEELHDLLTPGREVKKLEIRHDDVRKQTTVLNCKTVALDTPDKVEVMLGEAQRNRTVAATKANERSSRSHSVFVLKLIGENSATHERCEGTLNLVDLAGSERLKHSQVEGERMRETQNINKSLACLGDVIEALGKGSSHIPYRNSKLTHLLQYSLGGNSKTLMFVMVSPLEAHLKETITSLRFATKVHNTHIGTAKSTKKLKGAAASGSSEY